MLYKSTKLLKSPGTLDRVKGNRHYGCELNSKLKWWFLQIDVNKIIAMTAFTYDISMFMVIERLK